MASIISNSIDPQAGSNLAAAVGQALEKSGNTDEDHVAMSHELRKAEMQYQLEHAKLELDDKKATMADVADARQNQTLVQQSDHASWLAKNIQPILSLAIVALTFYLYWYIMFGDHASLKEANSPMKDIIIYILGALTTVSTQVVSYFFGSSHGSSEKTKTLSAVLSNRA